MALLNEEVQSDQTTSEWMFTTADGERWSCDVRFTAMSAGGGIEFEFFLKKCKQGKGGINYLCINLHLIRTICFFI